MSTTPAPDLPPVCDSDVRRVQSTIISWFAKNARPLPWRDPSTTPWAILVSEIMSQQTPVLRVEPRWREWMDRWPTPADLAAAPTAEVLHAWDRLGYPRRALRLQEAAREITENHHGQVPRSVEELRSLPGIGAYTAAAVSSFAYGQRSTVLDTNIRRVLIRVFAGRERPTTSPSRRETAWAEGFVPATDHQEWNAGIMEFGALVCTARSPRCEGCPLADVCSWRIAGSPTSASPRSTQKWAGTDRQLRGAIMDVLKHAHAADAPANPSAVDEDAAGAAIERAVRIDVLTATTAEFDLDLLDALEPRLAAAVVHVRDLSADRNRILRLISDLVADGLAQTSDGVLSLPH